MYDFYWIKTFPLKSQHTELKGSIKTFPLKTQLTELKGSRSEGNNKIEKLLVTKVRQKQVFAMEEGTLLTAQSSRGAH